MYTNAPLKQEMQIFVTNTSPQHLSMDCRRFTAVGDFSMTDLCAGRVIAPGEKMLLPLKVEKAAQMIEWHFYVQPTDGPIEAAKAAAGLQTIIQIQFVDQGPNPSSIAQ